MNVKQKCNTFYKQQHAVLGASYLS